MQDMGGTDEEKIESALSAGPPSITENATVMDWPSDGGEARVLREGNNGWVCYPVSAEALAQGANDPMCLDAAWQEWLDAVMNQRDPELQQVGTAYMLQGDRGVSNIDPMATEPTADNQWIVAGPHLMIVPPDTSMLEGISTDPNNGGPWVMWPDTPYAHIMAPLGPNQ